MSASRYIIRSEETFDPKDPEIEDADIVNVKFPASLDSWNKHEGVQKYDLSTVNLITLIKDLYPYKDIIDYKSSIIILFEKIKYIESVSSKLIEKPCRYNDYKVPSLAQGQHKDGKCMEIEQVHVAPHRNIVEEDSGLGGGWKSNHEFYHPQCALLFDKNNNCLKIDISEGVLNILFSNGTRYENYRMYPIGYSVWKADFMYSDSDHTLFGYPIEEKYIDFFSTNRPSFKALRLGMENLFTMDFEEWLNENIQHIREDLGLVEKLHKKPEIKYIQYSDAVHVNSMVKELKNQIENLRKIGVDVDSIEW